MKTPTIREAVLTPKFEYNQIQFVTGETIKIIARPVVYELTLKGDLETLSHKYIKSKCRFCAFSKNDESWAVPLGLAEVEYKPYQTGDLVHGSNICPLAGDKWYYCTMGVIYLESFSNGTVTTNYMVSFSSI